LNRTFKIVGAAAVILGMVGVVIAARGGWLNDWLPESAEPSPTASPSATDNVSGSGAPMSPNEQVKLSPQAEDNLRLSTGPMRITTYRKTIEIPGRVVDRPGVSDRGVVSPAAGVVSAIHRHAGDVVRPGEPLFTLRLVGESLHSSQTELFKATKDQEITREQIARLDGLAQSGGIPQSRLIELRNDLRRSEVAVQAHRQDLRLRGLSAEQIDGVAEGNFVSEVVVVVPPHTNPTDDPPEESPSSELDLAPQATEPAVFEVKELTARLGQQFQAGETLCSLSNHQSLFIEGQAFQKEVALLQRAAENRFPIRVEILEETEQGWPESIPAVVIHHISNTLNDDNRTVAFYLPLENQFRTYERGSDKGLVWRFRPGQRVRLHLEFETLKNVFVLPAEAVVKEGPEFYLFRRDGEVFKRRPVHVVHQTRDEVVIANDGSVPPGIHVAKNGAVQLNRVLKSQGSPAPAGVHVHADGSVHTNR